MEATGFDKYVTENRLALETGDVKMDELLNRSMSQNFIPVTDDRDYFIGIVTRQDIIRSFVGSTQPSESNA